MLEITIEKRGELYKDYQMFRLKINGRMMIEGDYAAQEIQDFMSQICVASMGITGNPTLAQACAMDPGPAPKQQIEDQRQRNDFRRDADKRNAAREMKPAEAKVTDPPAPLLRLPDLPIRRRPRPENMRPNKSTWRKTVEFFTGKSE